MRFKPSWPDDVITRLAWPVTRHECESTVVVARPASDLELLVLVPLGTIGTAVTVNDMARRLALNFDGLLGIATWLERGGAIRIKTTCKVTKAGRPVTIKHASIPGPPGGARCKAVAARMVPVMRLKATITVVQCGRTGHLFAVPPETVREIPGDATRVPWNGIEVPPWAIPEHATRSVEEHPAAHGIDAAPGERVFCGDMPVRSSSDLHIVDTIAWSLLRDEIVPVPAPGLDGEAHGESLLLGVPAIERDLRMLAAEPWFLPGQLAGLRAAATAWKAWEAIGPGVVHALVNGLGSLDGIAFPDTVAIPGIPVPSPAALLDSSGLVAWLRERVTARGLAAIDTGGFLASHAVDGQGIPVPFPGTVIEHAGLDAGAGAGAGTIEVRDGTCTVTMPRTAIPGGEFLPFPALVAGDACVVPAIIRADGDAGHGDLHVGHAILPVGSVPGLLGVTGSLHQAIAGIACRTIDSITGTPVPWMRDVLVPLLHALRTVPCTLAGQYMAAWDTIIATAVPRVLAGGTRKSKDLLPGALLVADLLQPGVDHDWPAARRSPAFQQALRAITTGPSGLLAERPHLASWLAWFTAPGGELAAAIPDSVPPGAHAYKPGRP